MTKRDLVNPKNNRLVAGVTEADVLDAVAKSGYPLQNVVADYFERATFRTVEEVELRRQGLGTVAYDRR
jgi:hypothetical protein